MYGEEAPTMMLSNKKRELSVIHNQPSKSVVMIQNEHEEESSV
jgi:hypothetical protein